MAEQEVVVKFRGDIRALQTSMDTIERDGVQAANTVQRGFARASDRIDRAFDSIQRSFRSAAARLESTLRGLKDRFEQAARGIDGAFRAIRGPALVATAAAGAFAVMAQRSLEATESMVDLANRANVSTEFLQGLRFAASQNGATFRDFDDAITRLNRRLGLFQNYLATSEGEAGPAANAFRALGLEAEIASGELNDAESVFRRIVTELQNVEGEARRAALASQLFGEDSGPRLVALLNQGEAGIQELTSRARELGLVLDDETAQGAATASAEIRALQQSFTAQVNNTIAEQADGLRDLAEALAVIASAALEAAAAFGSFISDLVTDETRAAVAAADLNVLIARRAELEEDARRANRIGTNSALARAQNYQQQIEQLDRSIERLQSREIEITGTPSFDAQAFGMPSFDAEAPGLSVETDAGAIEPFDDLANAAKEASDAIVNGVEGAKDSVTELDGKVELLDESLKDMSAEPIEIEIDQTALDRFLEKTLEMEDVFVSSMQRLEDSIVDALMTGRFEIDDFVEYALRQLARLYVQRAIINPIVDAAGGLFGGGGASLTGIGKAATGGPSSGLTLVGEQGPEIVNLGPMANVMTASMTRKALQGQQMGGESGGSVSVSTAFNIDARGAQIGVEEQIAQAIAQATPIIEQRAVNAAYSGLARTQRNRRAS